MKLVIEIPKEVYNNAKNDMLFGSTLLVNAIKTRKPQEPKTGHCKDCKWWKDSDGAFRRGIGAESICRINTDEVYQGEGYCYLFEPQESEEE